MLLSARTAHVFAAVPSLSLDSSKSAYSFFQDKVSRLQLLLAASIGAGGILSSAGCVAAAEEHPKKEAAGDSSGEARFVRSGLRGSEEDERGTGWGGRMPQG